MSRENPIEQMVDKPETPTLQNETAKAGKTDEELLGTIASVIGVDKEDERYSRIRSFIQNSYQQDVSFEVDRWTRGYEDEDLSEALDVIRRRGYEAEARNWLFSALPEGMKFGKATREERIAKAEELARRAGMSVEDIVGKYGIST